MTREEIVEYPYEGVITRIVEGHGDNDDEELTVYEGVMDEHMVSDDEGRILQTASYIISIPLTKDDNDDYIVPRKGDSVSLTRYGEELNFTVDNAEPSQLMGISVYCTRKDWN
jgi:hypothetical protein